jgi:hypothetical protein
LLFLEKQEKFLVFWHIRQKWQTAILSKLTSMPKMAGLNL